MSISISISISTVRSEAVIMPFFWLVSYKHHYSRRISSVFVNSTSALISPLLSPWEEQSNERRYIHYI